MNDNEKLFLKLLSSALSGEKYNVSSGECNFEKLYNIAVCNSCLSLIYQGTVNCSLDFPPHWKRFSSFIVIDSYKKLKVQTEIIEILKQNAIRACILKGSSVALNYSNPLSRSMGDIDILVDEENYEKSALLFTTQKVIDANRHDFHIGFNYKNVKVEIHKHITDRTNKTLQVYNSLADAMNHIHLKVYEGFDIPVLSEEYQAVSLLEHMLRHFKDNEFVFRMFCDWVCFAKNIESDKWNNTVYPFIEKSGLIKFCDALNKCSSEYLGIDLHTRQNSDIDDKICQILIEEFLSVDKAHQKGGIDATLGTLISRYRKEKKNIVSAYICAVNRIAKNKYSIGKYKIFQPVFWLWLPLKYGFNVILGRRKKIDFAKMGKVAGQREIIIENLDLHN